MGTGDGRVIGTTKIVDNGPDNARWNLVIVGDGYREAELATYRTDVTNFVNRLRTTAPLDTLFDGINVHRVEVASTESGADDPTQCGGTGATRRTYFDATFCSVGPGGVRYERLLTVDTALALSVASAQVPRRHQVLCIVNSSKYGGAGGTVAVTSTHASAPEIAIHELGHSAFGLADEYGGNGTGTPAGEPSQPNVTRNTNRTGHKWGTLIAAATPMPSQCNPSCTGSTCRPPATPPLPGAVGTYEGGIYSDCTTYRPLPDCYMRTLGRPFCPVCARVIRQVLRPFQPPIAADDCLGYDPRALRIVNEGAAGWLLTDGRSRMQMLDNETDARNALALARRHTARCFIGRNNRRPNRLDYIVTYWTGNSGISTVISGEDCIRYDRANLRVVDEGARGWLLTDGRSRMLTLDNEADARKALAVTRQHSMQCFIGRNNRRPDRKRYILGYWR
jgi:hypothetical protein